MNEETPKLLTTNEVSDILGISPNTILEKIKTGEIKSRKEGNKYYYRLEDINEYKLSLFSTKLVNDYLEDWIGAFTWPSHHPYDMERYYKFLKVLIEQSKHSYSRHTTKKIRIWYENLRQTLTDKVNQMKPGYEPTYLQEILDPFIEAAETIAEFLEAGFWGGEINEKYQKFWDDADYNKLPPGEIKMLPDGPLPSPPWWK